MRRPGLRDVQPVKDLVTYEEAMEAKVYLDEIAHDWAEAYADVDYYTYLLRQTEALGAQMSDERAANAKLWDARTSEAYTNAVRRLRDAQTDMKLIEHRRQAALLKLELYRTIRADKRAREIIDNDSQRQQ